MKVTAFTRLQNVSLVPGIAPNAPGCWGVQNDMLFLFCYWPKLDRPTKLFADGSTGIKVMGRTPRNVWFPDDVEFLDYYPDALYPAEQAVFAAFPYRGRALINLSPAEAQVWLDAYNAAIATFPPTHVTHPTTRNSNFLRHKEVKSERTIVLKEDGVLPDGTILRAGAEIVKYDYEEFIADLTTQECVDLMNGTAIESELRQTKAFVCSDASEKTLEQWIIEKAAVEAEVVK